MIIYIILAGYPPFHDEDQNRLYRKIKAGHFRFDPEYWNDVSSEAKVRPYSVHAIPTEFSLVVFWCVMPWVITWVFYVFSVIVTWMHFLCMQEVGIASCGCLLPLVF